MPRILLAISLLLLLFGCSQNPKENNETEIRSAETVAPDTTETVEEEILPEADIERTEWQNPDLVLNLLGSLNNKVVADIGAGSGYFTFKIARQAKKVIALDIDPNSLEYINGQKEIVGPWAENIETRLTPPDVPNLLEEEVDVVLIVNTYAYIPNKEDYLARLKKTMKQNARLVIIDFKTGEIPVGPSDETKVDARQVIKSLRAAGFSRTKTDERSLQYQYIITAEND